MPKTKAVSFRIPSKYLMFLDCLATENHMSRTEVLINMLDVYLVNYLRATSRQTTAGGDK